MDAGAIKGEDVYSEPLTSMPAKQYSLYRPKKAVYKLDIGPQMGGLYGKDTAKKSNDFSNLLCIVYGVRWGF